MEFSRRGFNFHSDKLSVATSKNLSVDHMYELILPLSCDYLQKSLIKIKVVTGEGKQPK